MLSRRGTRIGLLAALVAAIVAVPLSVRACATTPVAPETPPLPVRPKDEVATFSQIMIGYRVEGGKSANLRTHEEAKALADRLVSQLQAGARMEPLIAQYTDDRADDGSVFNGGTYTIARKTSRAQPFVKDAVFSLARGQLLAHPLETGRGAILIIRRDD